ncbi:MAG: mechanosensitive ion channel domain-containing protein [Haloferula sp.]
MKHLVLIIAFLSCLPLLSQESEPAPETKQAAVTPAPSVKPEILKLQLAPLTAAELAEEAKHWQDAVKAGAKVVADAAVRNAESTGDAKKKALDDMAKAREAEAKMLANFEVVLSAWEAKGGDAAEMRLYASSVSGTKLDIKDTSALVDSFNRWIKSENGAIKWLGKIAGALVILLITWIISGFVEKLVNKAMAKHKGTSELLDRFVEKVIRRTLLAIGALMALSTLGVQIGPLLALLGGGAFIVGFALQDTLSNFANGVMLLIYQPFDVGDAVEVGGISGSVDSVSLVNTTIRTWDNKVVLVPNKSVWGQTITNINAAGERRVDMVFGIGYDDDIDKAQAILEKIVSETEGVLEEPATTIKMHELADSSVNFVCRPWAKSSDYWAVHWTITKRVKEEFDAAGISIPYPQTDIHIHKVD